MDNENKPYKVHMLDIAYGTTIMTFIFSKEEDKLNLYDKLYKWKFNLTRTLILFVNKIPRGRGRAPKIVQPEGEITSESLKNHFDKTRHMIKKLDTLQANSFFKHPYFGDLNLETTKHFLILHTNHHLKIIKDIIK